MLKIVALGTNLKTSDKDFIHGMFKSVLEITPAIKDVISHKIKTDSTEIVVTFGNKARDLFLASKEKYLSFISFPEVKQLVATEENEQNRQQAYEQLLSLKALKEPVDSVKAISEESLPAIDTNVLLESLRKTGMKEWQGITRNGKKIKLTMDPAIDKTVDVNLTFAELFVLKAAMETLQIKEFQIVCGNKEGNKE